jgi:ATP-dependent RNA helicase DDX52/ROK1
VCVCVCVCVWVCVCVCVRVCDVVCSQVRVMVGAQNVALNTVSQRFVYCGDEAGKLLGLWNVRNPCRVVCCVMTRVDVTADSRWRGDAHAGVRAGVGTRCRVGARFETRRRAVRDDVARARMSSNSNVSADALHGDMAQSERDAVIEQVRACISRSDPDRHAQFRTGELFVLVSTDLLSRGVDYRAIETVVNYDVPQTVEE